MSKRSLTRLGVAVLSLAVLAPSMAPAQAAGEIKIGGTPIVFGDTAGVISRGVGMVHQHFQLVPVMTVAENLILGDEPKRGIFINQKAARAEIIALSKRYGLEVDPDAVIEDLPVGM